ncbi:hypothetical protein ACIOUE_39985, partial [Streptomyces xanthochromogenes]|uniref:hypothetical protein n=1 Tax=Streptomyces xanthochromogenes TaxID=67384 RepID=UPI00381D0BED
MAVRWFFGPGGLPGLGQGGLDALAEEPAFACRFLNPLRTPAGVSLSLQQDLCGSLPTCHGNSKNTQVATTLSCFTT